MHLTLHFVGDLPRHQIEPMRESIARSVAGINRFELTVQRLISLPKQGPARLIAVETDAPPPLLEIQSRLVRRLARKPRRRGSDRFLPHLTVCRFRTPAVSEGFDESLGSDQIAIEQVRLMNSVLSSQGAQHTEIAKYDLEAR